VDQLVTVARHEGQRVAVVAVDPSSPFSGGAILGDRIRMEDHTGDDGVYIRSLSSRGHLGGLSAATTEVVDLLDAAGFDRIVVETVGVGQSELGVMEVADTAIVVLTPESGDAVQAMKAGLLEVADVFVVNKADRPGADRLVRELERMIELDPEAPGRWTPPVCAVVATERKGVDQVVARAVDHLAWCVGDGLPVWRARRGAARVRLALDLVAEEARRGALARLRERDLLDRLREGSLTAHEAARRLA
jgi:LAO/AO transport system kinase